LSVDEADAQARIGGAALLPAASANADLTRIAALTRWGSIPSARGSLCQAVALRDCLADSRWVGPMLAARG